MTRLRIIVAAAAVGCLTALAVWVARRPGPPQGDAPPAQPVTAQGVPPGIVGSSGCRDCHQRFYELWSTSHHGLAMRPFTPAFARQHLPGQPGQIHLGPVTYTTQITDAGGQVIETGPAGTRHHPILHVLGGKNVCYFLTQLDRGRLQVLPLAYDLRRKAWFDTQASALRHFHDAASEVLPWRDPAYTFNTSCHSCHVSQLSRNYDLASDTYHTTWAEPGINCETCHGPGGEHVRAARQLKPGQPMPDPKLIVTRSFTSEQHNATCAPCHAKMAPLTTSFLPGQRYFDHYDLTTLEDPDFHPDGRDRGENYTFTLWRMSPCAKSGQLSCIHCHTSSGRYRFKTENPNGACLPCHEAKVKNPAAHTHHDAAGEGSRCIACHMPMTEFARMRRSDHSMRPPTPAATIAHKSPNACNLCHADHDAAWADAHVRRWHPEDYQAPTLLRADLLAAARKRDWSRLPEMLDQITGLQRDEVYATSFIRLLDSCTDSRKWPALRHAAKDASPLVRSAAVAALARDDSDQGRAALLAATGDDYRLVRIRAAAALAAHPLPPLHQRQRQQLDAASAELEQSFASRPDDWSSHYNLGNLHADRNQPDRALAAFEQASRLRPDVIHPLVNASLLYARIGQTHRAHEALRKALTIDPANAAANFNMGLLQAELGDAKQAELHLRAALKADPGFAEAAYNLAVLLSRGNPRESLALARQAHGLRPDDPKYAYTLAFFLDANGNPAGAAELLGGILARDPGHADAVLLLGAICHRQGQPEQARAVYQKALASGRLSPADRQTVQRQLDASLSR